jgi:hypothetical protein
MREEWKRVVGRMPAGWFTLEMLPVLEEFVRNVCYCRDLTGWLDKVDPLTLEADDWRQYNEIHRKYAKATQTMAMCAGRLQLTGSTQRKTTGARALVGTDPTSPDKPWTHDAATNDIDEAAQA